mmetsp:Transcript_51653/g.58526  ORF Transcript_51653/g.58526 Transcript_51653/m.58526 type:complete len:135 (+) Transcript_51653:98-502(+)
MNNKISMYYGNLQLHLPVGVLITAQLPMKETIWTGKTNKDVPSTGCEKLGQWDVCRFKHKKYSDNVLKTTTVTIHNNRVVTALVTLKFKGDDKPLSNGWKSMHHSLPSIKTRSSPLQPQPQPQPNTTFSLFQTL